MKKKGFLRHRMIRMGILPNILIGTLISVILSEIITYTMAVIFDATLYIEMFIIAFTAPAIITPILIYFFMDLLLRIHQLEQKNRQLAEKDSLTGINNRRAFFHQAKNQFELYLLKHKDLSIIYMDLDHFKNINDRYGHQGGDKVLQRVSKLIELSIRCQDCLGRIGGEEFAVVLPDTSQDGAKILAENLRKAIESEVIEYDNREIKLTASLGIASTEDDFSGGLDELTSNADKALYEAKRQGRNRTVLFKS